MLAVVIGGRFKLTSIRLIYCKLVGDYQGYEPTDPPVGPYPWFPPRSWEWLHFGQFFYRGGDFGQWKVLGSKLDYCVSTIAKDPIYTS